MSDAIVQMIRNFMCCIKDLQLFPDSILYKELLKDYLPAPFNQTTLLEMAISTTQLYACLSISTAALRMMLVDGYSARTKLLHWQSKNKQQYDNNSSIIQQRFQQQYNASLRAMWVGINVLFIGIAFFWLFANSWHVTETNMIGGIQGLIHALTIMLISMLPLLWYMMSDAMAMIGKAANMEYLISMLRQCSNTTTIPSAMITKETLELLNDQNKSLETVKLTITDIQESADRLQDMVPIIRYQAYREIIYFIINFIAFYGYLLGVVAYYASEDVQQSLYVRTLKFGMSNADADWHGNFAGDIMWTIEPILILTTPTIFAWLKPKCQPIKTKSE